MTDVGISALGQGCGQLKSINLGSCDQVTNAGRLALGHKCSVRIDVDDYGCQICGEEE